MEDYGNLTKGEKTAFWQEHIEKWEESGLTQAMYCREHGLNKNAFTWRKRSLSGRVKPRITQIPTKTVTEITNIQSSLDLTINDAIRLTIDQNFDPELLKKVLKTLGAWNDNQLV